MNRISEIRRAAGISQLALVDQLRWSQGRLSNYEAGRRVPGLAECRAIVRGLNELGACCTLDDVFPPEPAQIPAAA
ncbi:helix-turn-helix transcriptional regulator [Ectopseudomonas khazarica]|uniref:helix-turn-helix transcriptional regulator n=1 Tax=Ectopseudomonas khazarica TaxID=2502979 RepID=UPI001AEF8E53|nr:helix-turn-helix transcriptional regulator [Pseudomonas khazarica]QTS88284.1 helix-turn-helix transcriptional regulator [Pseudomonas khazarica]